MGSGQLWYSTLFGKWPPGTAGKSSLEARWPLGRSDTGPFPVSGKLP